MERLVQDLRSASVHQITAGSNQGSSQVICENTVRRTLDRMGYASRRLVRTHLQFTQDNKHWIVKH